MQGAVSFITQCCTILFLQHRFGSIVSVKSAIPMNSNYIVTSQYWICCMQYCMSLLKMLLYCSALGPVHFFQKYFFQSVFPIGIFTKSLRYQANQYELNHNITKFYLKQKSVLKKVTFEGKNYNSMKHWEQQNQIKNDAEIYNYLFKVEYIYRNNICYYTTCMYIQTFTFLRAQGGVFGLRHLRCFMTVFFYIKNRKKIHAPSINNHEAQNMSVFKGLEVIVFTS